MELIIPRGSIMQTSAANRILYNVVLEGWANALFGRLFKADGICILATFVVGSIVRSIGDRQVHERALHEIRLLNKR